MSDIPREQVFRSIHHPGARSTSVVAGSALVRPLGFCMLPVMIGALFAMLQGFPALPWLTVGFPLAAALALAWTWHAIRSRICAVVVVGDRVAVQSEFEAAEPSAPLQWKWILDLNRAPGHADLTLGLSAVRLQREEWPEWDEMMESLHWATRSQPDVLPPTGSSNPP